MIDDDKDARSSATSQAFEKASMPTPASELERQQLLDSMAKPKKAIELTPNGTTEKEVNQQVDEAKLARIKEIETRLRNAREVKSIQRSFDQKRSR
ncbi:hypothetical protein [uncultured Tateyamaria sp.]|uniref:hypothetical protein n=1 Tax=uncultured Tateyamaria sp. TaxID=455651 RepID=UPI00261797FB|nr:hypothetical protein [uncultured Tateyamaria sp.]